MYGVLPEPSVTQDRDVPERGGTWEVLGGRQLHFELSEKRQERDGSLVLGRDGTVERTGWRSDTGRSPIHPARL